MGRSIETIYICDKCKKRDDEYGIGRNPELKRFDFHFVDNDKTLCSKCYDKYYKIDDDVAKEFTEEYEAIHTKREQRFNELFWNADL